jgi:hypothetical protein
MSLEASFPDFTCSDCGSPSIRIDGPLSSSTQVHCGGCNKYLCDWSDFVSNTEALLACRATPFDTRDTRVAPQH